MPFLFAGSGAAAAGGHRADRDAARPERARRGGWPWPAPRSSYRRELRPAAARHARRALPAGPPRRLHAGRAQPDDRRGGRGRCSAGGRERCPRSRGWPSWPRSVLTRFGVFQAGLASARTRSTRRAAAGAAAGHVACRVTTTRDARPADPVRLRRGLRLQGAAGRARADPGRPAAVGQTRGPAGRARQRRRRRRGAASTASAPSSPPPTSSRRSSTTPTTGAGSRPRTPCPTSTRWAASRWSPSTCSPGRARRLPFELAARGAARGRGGLRRGAVPPRRRAQHRRPRAQVRPGGHRPRRPDRLLRNDAGVAGLPLTLTKPLGLGVLNNRHKATGEAFAEAVAAMTALNRDASRAALAAGRGCATDVTGFGLLGHLYKLLRASGVSAVVDAAAVPYLDGARERWPTGYVPGGSRRNLDWVRPTSTSAVDEASCCCWPTPRPRGACWSPARCRATPSSASWYPTATTARLPFGDGTQPAISRSAGAGRPVWHRTYGRKSFIRSPGVFNYRWHP